MVRNGNVVRARDTHIGGNEPVVYFQRRRTRRHKLTLGTSSAARKTSLGKSVVNLVRQYAGFKVRKAEFEVTSWLGDSVKVGVYSEKALLSILAGSEPLWQGNCSPGGTPTRTEVMELAPPKRTVVDALKVMSEE